MPRSKHILPFLLEGAVQEIDPATSTESWNQLTSFVNIDNTVVCAFTVGSPLQKVPGALLSIIKENANGADVNITLTDELDDEFKTIVLGQIDNSVLLMWNGEKWQVLAQSIEGEASFAGGTVSGATTFSNAVDVTTGGLTIDAGGLTVTLGGANVTGGITMPTGNLAITSGNATVGGTLTQTGLATFTTGYQATPAAHTATNNGTGTGAVADGTSYVEVTSNNAAHLITLPPPTPGNIVHLFVGGSTAYELQSSAPATVAINGGVGASASSTVAANTLVKCVCTSATTWVATQFSSTGAATALEAAS